MQQHLHREIETMITKLAKLGGLVEENIGRALTSLRESDAGLVKEVREVESHIDRFEVELEEDCLKILALYQPVARDLRFLITVIKVLKELENIGDLAEKIAKKTRRVSASQMESTRMDLLLMGEKAKVMVGMSLDALLKEDVKLAKEVLNMDDEVDRLHRNHHMIIAKEIKSMDQEISETELALLSVSRSLERMADLATNIAEDVIYYVDAQIVRHNKAKT